MTRPGGRVRVLIVDDSAVARVLFSRALGSDPLLHVIGEAGNGKEALAAVASLDPDLVLMDVSMPVMDGLAATEALMRTLPRPILMISDLVGKDAHLNFRALAAGALDLIGKPSGAQLQEVDARARLCRRIRALAEVPVVRRIPVAAPIVRSSALPAPTERSENDAVSYKLLCIGASTGGPPALVQVLRDLGPKPPWPVVVVQHISAGFVDGMASWLQTSTALPVSVVRTLQYPERGAVYLAPDDRHLELARNGLLSLSDGPLQRGLRPAVDALFNSVAATPMARNSIAVLLTGMGEDGARGMKAMREAGAWTIAQDAASSVVDGMPRVAREMGAAREVLPLEAIGGRCVSLSS